MCALHTSHDKSAGAAHLDSAHVLNIFFQVKLSIKSLQTLKHFKSSARYAPLSYCLMALHAKS